MLIQQTTEQWWFPYFPIVFSWKLSSYKTICMTYQKPIFWENKTKMFKMPFAEFYQVNLVWKFVILTFTTLWASSADDKLMIFEPAHDKPNKTACAPSEDSD